MLGAGYGHSQVEDLLVADGLTDAFDNIAMGLCGEDTAEKMGFTREQCDEFALEVRLGGVGVPNRAWGLPLGSRVLRRDSTFLAAAMVDPAS